MSNLKSPKHSYDKLHQCGLFIKNRRREQGFTQTMLAEKAGVSVDQIFGLEHGYNVRLSVFIAAINALGFKIAVKRKD